MPSICLASASLFLLLVAKMSLLIRYSIKAMKRGRKSVADLKENFENLREASFGESQIKEILRSRESRMSEYLERWLSFSKESDEVYPSQGLLLTPYDYLEVKSLTMLPQQEIVETLRMRRYFLELFNHPYRMSFLNKVSKGRFVAPSMVEGLAMERAIREGVALSVGDLGAAVIGVDKERVSRKDRYAQGPFVKLGRQGRTPFVGSASPDVWNSSAAIATMAASHCLAAIPRNGLMASVKRQTDLAIEVFEWLDNMGENLLGKRKDRNKILGLWRNNVMGTLEANPKKVIERAKSLYDAGVRAFRVYSPEPGLGVVDTVSKLRKEFGEKIEIFAGQVVEVAQAEQLEKLGADGIFVGIGGGGRCITGVRSGSAIDWPELVWKMRGRLKIPVVVEGGASDHVAVTLLLGATGVSVSRVVSGGTIESSGGALFCVNSEGMLFKPYGGEASARTKYLDGKMQPFGIPSFVEGETTKAMKSYVKFVYPTLTYNLHLLLEDAILAMVFRGVNSIEELHQIDPSPLRQITASGEFQRKTH